MAKRATPAQKAAQDAKPKARADWMDAGIHKILVALDPQVRWKHFAWHWPDVDGTV